MENTLMDNDKEIYLKKHKELIKLFYLSSTPENLLNLFNNTWKSNNDCLIEEFIKLSSLSADRNKFKPFIGQIVRKYRMFGIKYYDELLGYKECRKIIEKYFEDIDRVVRGEIKPNEKNWIINGTENDLK